MRHIPVAKFKDNASEIIAAAEAGEEIVITRHGRPAVRMTTAIDSAERERRAWAALGTLAAMRARMRADGRTATMDEMIAWKNEGRR
jgi:prevent-host-death family protein